MKPNLRNLALAPIILLAACKDDAPEPQPTAGETFPVTFKVSNLTQHVEEMPDRSVEAVDTATVAIRFIDFFVYNAAGELESLLQYFAEHLSHDYPFFGEAHFNLPRGRYRLVVWGTQFDPNYSDSTNYSDAYLLPYESPGDIFHREITFTVTGEETMDTIRLDRLVGELEFRLTETPDDLVQGYHMDYRTVIAFPFDARQPYEYGYVFVPGISGKVIPFVSDLFVFREKVLPDRSGNFDATPVFSVHGPRGHVYDGRKLSKVFVYPNKRTIVTGTVYHNELYENFYIEADSAYEAPIHLDTDDIVIE